MNPLVLLSVLEHGFEVGSCKKLAVFRREPRHGPAPDHLVEAASGAMSMIRRARARTTFITELSS